MRAPITTKETSIQIAGASVSTTNNDERQSLSSHFTKVQIILILLFVTIGVGCEIWDTFYNVSAYTYYSVNIKSLPSAPDFSYSKSGHIGGYSVMDGVTTYFGSGSYYNGTITLIVLIILPYLYVLVLMTIFFIKVKRKYRKHRTICLFVLVLIGQLQSITTYSGSFVEMITANITSTPNYDFLLETDFTNSACIFVLWETVFMILAFILLWVDQFKSYKTYEFNTAKFDDDQLYILSSVHTKDIKSLFGIVIYSLYLTMLICSVYILLESMWTAQVAFNFGGVFAGPDPQPLVYSSYFMAINISDYLHINGFLSAMYTADIMFYVLIIPLTEQVLLVLIWFIPFKNRPFRYLLRFIIWLQAMSQFCALYVGSIMVVLNGEIKTYTAYFMEHETLPNLCGDGTFIKDTFSSGCYYAASFYSIKGMILMGIAIVIKWVILIYTIHVSNKVGINAIKLA